MKNDGVKEQIDTKSASALGKAMHEAEEKSPRLGAMPGRKMTLLLVLATILISSNSGRYIAFWLGLVAACIVAGFAITPVLYYSVRGRQDTEIPVFTSGYLFDVGETLKPLGFTKPTIWKTYLENRKRAKLEAQVKQRITAKRRLAESIDALIDTIMELFIDSWYKPLSSDEIVRAEIEQILRFMIADLFKRASTVDPMTLAIFFVQNATQHFSEADKARSAGTFSTHQGDRPLFNSQELQAALTARLAQFGQEAAEAAEAKSKGGATKLPSAGVFKKVDLHPALQPSSGTSSAGTSNTELDWLRQAENTIASCIYRAVDRQSSFFSIIVREIVVNGLIFPAINLLSDPDFINQAINAYTGKAIQERKMVQKLRNVLRRHTPGFSNISIFQGNERQRRPRQTATKTGAPRNAAGSEAAGMSKSSSLESLSPDAARKITDLSAAMKLCTNFENAMQIKNDLDACISRSERDLSELTTAKRGTDEIEAVQKYLKYLAYLRRKLEKRLHLFSEERDVVSSVPALVISPPQRRSKSPEVANFPTGQTDGSNTRRRVLSFHSRAKSLDVRGLSSSISDFASSFSSGDRASRSRNLSLARLKSEALISASHDDISRQMKKSAGLLSIDDAYEYAGGRRRRSPVKRDITTDDDDDVDDGASRASVESADEPDSQLMNAVQQALTFMVGAPNATLGEPGDHTTEADMTVMEQSSEVSADESETGFNASIQPEDAMRTHKEKTPSVVSVPIMKPPPNPVKEQSAAAPYLSVVNAITRIPAQTKNTIYNQFGKKLNDEKAEKSKSAPVTERSSPVLTPMHGREYLWSESSPTGNAEYNLLNTSLNMPSAAQVRERIAALDAQIDKFLKQKSVLDNLLKNADAEDQTEKYRILQMSRDSVVQDIEDLMTIKEQYERQKGKTLTIEPGSTTVMITSCTVGHNGFKDFALYIIEVQQKNTLAGLPVSKWIIAKRYSDFFNLHQQLKSKFTQVKSFDFPGKRAFLILHKNLVESRKVSLEKYLQVGVKVRFRVRVACC